MDKIVFNKLCLVCVSFLKNAQSLVKRRKSLEINYKSHKYIENIIRKKLRLTIIMRIMPQKIIFYLKLSIHLRLITLRILDKILFGLNRIS